MTDAGTVILVAYIVCAIVLLATVAFFVKFFELCSHVREMQKHTKQVEKTVKLIWVEMERRNERQGDG